MIPGGTVIAVNSNALANVGPEPRDCDVCHNGVAVADAKTKLGPWGYLCLDCLRVVGVSVELTTNISPNPITL